MLNQSQIGHGNHKRKYSSRLVPRLEQSPSGTVETGLLLVEGDGVFMGL